MEVFGGGASGKSPRYFISLASDNYLGDSHISVQQRDSACLIVKGNFSGRDAYPSGGRERERYLKKGLINLQVDSEAKSIILSSCLLMIKEAR